MKKLALVIAMSGFFMAGASQAASNDVAATLAITGSVQSADNGCTVELDRSVMHIGDYDMASLPFQGQSSSSTANTNVARFTGENCSSSGVAIKFTGTADDQEGSAFVNTTTGSAAAQGIGISVYNGLSNSVMTPNTSSSVVLNKEFLFKVGMVKLKNTSTAPGQVQSSITVEVERL
ncbi:fimbrial protein [Cronobacter dublinensis]|uniref:Type 1 fimbrial protein n=1 Tax=Cronobacter dublinensis TaxID=413497 RepID=A0A9Q4T4M6_9ENTR|nr:fimbrial protein [Cronobacter dublinensis]ELY2857072.1 fimbrial protein [Cronobacter dublinensis]MDI6476052.1 fimbrial protein [Cronobacter dublinensis]NCH88903.1 type 1 fimbrial protein [Cronobacter dublinensis]NHV91059.1 fimbrial protein [Cronobacter dublinensis]